MAWLSNNWIWILVGGGFIAMHLFGHGHGSHRSHQTSDGDAGPRDATPQPSTHTSHASNQTLLEGEVLTAEGKTDGDEHNAPSSQRHKRHGGC